MRVRQPPEQRRVNEKCALRNADELELVRPVDNSAGVHGEQQDRECRGGGDEANEERAVAEKQGEPSERHHLHPGPDERQRLPDQEQAEVPVAEENAKWIDRARGRHALNIRAVGLPTMCAGDISSEGRIVMRFHTYSKFSPEM